MLRRMSVAAIAAVLALSPLWITGCSDAGGGDTLVVAVESQPKSLDPRLGSGDSVSARLHQIIFDSLVRKNERFEYVPHLAESFQQSPDAKTFTFRLRPGVKFQNGKDLTANDVKFTYTSVTSPEVKSPVAASFSRIDSIETPDPLTVIFHCREPYYSFLGDLMAVPVMQDGASSVPGATPVGTGPFKVVDASEQVVELEANPDYFLGAPKVKKLRVRVVSDNNTRELELRSGGVDLAINSGFAPDTVSKMKSDPDLQVVVAPGTNIAHLGLNTTDDVLKNVKVRQALAYAVNRDQIVNTVLQGQARPADAILPPESWAYEAGVTKYPYDPARAKQLLDEAGFPDPDGDGPSPRFTIEFVTSNSGIAPQIAQIVQEQWKAVGIGVNNTQFERTTFFERLTQGNYDAYFVISVGGNQTTDVFGWAYYANYWAPDRGELDAAAVRIRGAQDPAAVAGEMSAMIDILARHEYCQSSEVDRLVNEARTASPDVKRQKLLAVYDLLTARGAGNRMRYCNPSLDDMILGAERATDREQQRKLYSQIQQTVAGEEPQIYLWYSANVIVARKRAGNLTIDPSGAWYFLKDVTLG